MEPETRLQLTDADRRIWQEELDGFVPRRIFDIHTHVYRWDFNTDPAKDSSHLHELIGKAYPVADYQGRRLCLWLRSRY